MKINRWRHWSKKNLVTNMWSHQYHLFVSNSWCSLLLESQLWWLYWWNGWTFLHLDRFKQNFDFDQQSEINCNYESISTIDTFVTSAHPTHGNTAKTFFKMAQTLMIMELDSHIGGNAVWVSHEKTEFQKIREHSYMILLGQYN